MGGNREGLIRGYFFLLGGDGLRLIEQAHLRGGSLLTGGAELAMEQLAFLLLQLIDAGLHDTFRLFDQEEKSFSWWDYRMNAFKRNLGARIDHILASTKLGIRCNSCWIDKDPRKRERPSDHTPVVAEFDL